MARKPVIKAVNLSKYYQMVTTIVKALDKVNLEIYSGEFIIIFGQSGCGKSTLMSLFAGLDKPTSGEVFVRGENLAELNTLQLSKYRRTKIGMVFQQYNLVPNMTSLENVYLPLAFEGISRRRRIKRARNVLELIGIADIERHTSSELSGGQQQRVSIARAWVTSPWIVFADEPTGNLDSKSADEVLRLLKQLNQKSKRTVILISHNPEYLPYADRVVYLKDGKVIRISGKIKGATKRRKRSELESLQGVGKTAAQNLQKAGFENMLDIASAKEEDLAQVNGVSKKLAKLIRKEAQEIIVAREGFGEK
ncbi:MAG: ATP-binding cassette domain-containing protein [Actinobacteria bacterium]|nr:MAG: ATP-binding cassette domain-containing protein [Actinomycetota bacterium]